MKFSKWIKPGTTETRIYLNGVTVNGKPFIAEEEGRWTVKCFGLSRGQIDSLMDLADDALAELNGGARVVSFADVLAVVK